VFLDARIRVERVGPDALAAALAATPDAAVLAEDGVVLPAGAPAERFAPGDANGHALSCGCCGARSPAAFALDRLFLARVTGRVPFFTRVLAATVSERGAVALEVALAQDPVVPMRYRAG